jgi:hypothetical protein
LPKLTDHSTVFANDLVDAIRGQLSAADCHALALRFIQEMSAWQFEPECLKPHDICGELKKEMKSIRGFGKKA